MTVHLVGAGPGDPGLLTRRGAELLARADVVLFDRLVDERLLGLARDRALLVDVGKRPHDDASPTQAEINELLVTFGRTFDVVVRLKGGDPFLFGRGSEELEALSGAGVDVEVVPGVSSAFAVPASAGIAVTRRGVASAVVVLTGHDVTGGTVDWARLTTPRTTLVVLMGVSELAAIATTLVAHGLPPTTPCALIERGTTDREALHETSLDALADAAVEPPTVLVIGEVVRHRAIGTRLGWHRASADTAGRVEQRPQPAAPSPVEGLPAV